MVDGIRFRIVQGKKADNDLRLEWQIPGGEWRAVSMAAGAIMADFWYENENVLYPPERGLLGGEKYSQYLGTAMHDGWEVADAVLQTEKAASRTAASRPAFVIDIDDADDPFADLEF